MTATKVTAQMVKELRERTGVGMGKCKAALDEAEGDIEKAIDNLRKSGLASAVKKEGRETKEGLVGVGESDKAVAFVEVNAETDFVTQNEKFKEFLASIAKDAAEKNISDLEKFMNSPSREDPTLTIDQYRALVIQGLGENIQVRRLTLLPKSADVSIGVYSHMGGKIVTAAVLEGSSGYEEVARNIAMHIAADNPEYLTSDDVPKDVKAKEEEIARGQVKNKPANIIDKIIQGKLKAYFDQVCLVHQKYVKDPSMTITKYVESAAKEAGKPLAIKSFLRWQIGE